MNDKKQQGTFGFVEKIAASLQSPYLVILMGALFAIDLFIPDPLPLVDELVLGLITILLARWQGRGKETPEPEAAEPPTKPPPKNVTPEPGIGR